MAACTHSTRCAPISVLLRRDMALPSSCASRASQAFPGLPERTANQARRPGRNVNQLKAEASPEMLTCHLPSCASSKSPHLLAAPALPNNFPISHPTHLQGCEEEGRATAGRFCFTNEHEICRDIWRFVPTSRHSDSLRPSTSDSLMARKTLSEHQLVADLLQVR